MGKHKIIWENTNVTFDEDGYVETLPSCHCKVHLGCFQEFEMFTADNAGCL